MGTLLTGGVIVTAADSYKADVRLNGEHIDALGGGIAQEHDQVINVEGCYVLPGGIDPHTHFDLPIGDFRTADDFANGTLAALMGGTTTIIDYATQFKGQSLSEALAVWRELAQNKCYTDYSFHMAITDWQEATPVEITRLVQEEGVTSFKMYMAYKHVLQADDAMLLSAFECCRDNKAVLCLHCENGDIIDLLIRRNLAAGRTDPSYHAVSRPVYTEQEAVTRAALLAEAIGAPLYIVHLSTAEGLAAAMAARSNGTEVYIETCPQYLQLNEGYLSGGFNGAKYVISPPLRPPHHQQALWDGAAKGEVDTIATDHCSFHLNGQKDRGIGDFSKIPNGMPGAQERMSLLYTYGVMTGKISLNQFVSLTATKAAKIFGLYPCKGTIAVGSEADVVVWDKRSSSFITKETSYSLTDYNPYEGFPLLGAVRHVFLRGHHVVKDGQLALSPLGRFIKRRAISGEGGL